MKSPDIIIVLLLFVLSLGCTQVDKNQSISSLHFGLNDSILQHPVELIYLNDYYYLFFNYANDSSSGQLGCAQSKDLVDWSIQPVSYEDNYPEVQSIVTDYNFRTNYSTDSPALIAMCPDTDQYGKLALTISNDNGLTWSHNAANDVFLPDYYEPIKDVKVFWYDDQEKWIMLTISGYEIRYYASIDFQNWEYINRFGDEVYLKSGEWNHIDFFPIEETVTKDLKWVLFISSDSGSPNEGSGVQYFVGDFNGYVFKASHNKPKWIDHGSDLYQAIVLSDYFNVGKDPVLVGTIFNSIYHKFNITTNPLSEFSILRSLSLEEKFHDYYLISEPVNTYENIAKEVDLIDLVELSDNRYVEKTQDLPIRINLTFNVNNRLYLGMAESFGIRLTSNAGDELILGYHAERRYFFVADPSIRKKYPDTWDGFNYAPYVTNEPTMDMTIIIDKNSVELFAMNGLISLSRKYAFNDESVQIKLFAEKGSITLIEGSLTEF